MALAFKKFSKDSTDIKELGTVKALAGKGGKVKFLRKNFKNKNKQVALVLTKKNGESTIVPCSQPLSEMLREGEITMSQLITLQVIEFPHRDKVDAKTGEPVIIHAVALPQDGQVQEFTIDELQEETLELSGDFLPENLITL